MRRRNRKKGRADALEGKQKPCGGGTGRKGARMAQRESRNRAEAEQEDGESGWCRGKVENVQGRTEIGGKRCI